MDERTQGLTLIELIIAVVIISLVSLGIMNIDYFSNFQVINASRRTAVQQEVTVALEHMTKQISNAVGGNYEVAGNNQFPVSITTIAGDSGIRVWVDGNNNGRRDAYPADHEIAYRWTAASGVFWYYAVCVGIDCNQAGSTAADPIAYQITNFAGNRNITDNYVNVVVTGRWRAAEAISVNNPEITMNARIKMPSVSAN